MNLILAGTLWVLGASAGAALIGYLVRRIGQDEGRPSNNDAAGQVFTIVSGLQAVVLAFVLVTLFDAVSDTREGAYTEAQDLVAVSWAMESLPASASAEVRAHSQSYLDTVIRTEWPAMRRGEPVGGPGWSRLDQIRTAVVNAQADGEFQEDRKSEALDKLNEVYSERHERLTRAFDRGVVAVVWFVLVVGSLVCVLLPNLFGGTRLFPHIVLVSTLAGALALLLFAIFQLQNPFSGGSKIEPEAFQWALDRLGRG
jgi:tellurite resistance protein